MKLSKTDERKVEKERDENFEIAALENLIEQAGGNPSIAERLFKVMKKHGFRLASLNLKSN